MSSSALRCYVCGKDADQGFSLMSMGFNVDRVFIVHTKRCLLQAKDEADVIVDVIVAKHRKRNPR